METHLTGVSAAVVIGASNPPTRSGQAQVGIGLVVARDAEHRVPELQLPRREFVDGDRLPRVLDHHREVAAGGRPDVDGDRDPGTVARVVAGPVFADFRGLVTGAEEAEKQSGNDSDGAHPASLASNLEEGKASGGLDVVKRKVYSRGMDRQNLTITVAVDASTGARRMESDNGLFHLSTWCPSQKMIRFLTAVEAAFGGQLVHDGSCFYPDFDTDLVGATGDHAEHAKAARRDNVLGDDELAEILFAIESVGDLGDKATKWALAEGHTLLHVANDPTSDDDYLNDIVWFNAPAARPSAEAMRLAASERLAVPVSKEPTRSEKRASIESRAQAAKALLFDAKQEARAFGVEEITTAIEGAIDDIEVAIRALDAEAEIVRDTEAG